MSKSSEAVKKWRKSSKERMINSMGNQCQICGYCKCHDALEFHHIDPNKKELSFGSLRANPASWNKIVLELEKSILLCSCCHREVHAGLTKLPETYAKFDKSYSSYKEDKKLINNCPVCGKEKLIMRVTCSKKCGGTLSMKNRYKNYDLEKMKNNMSYSEIADEIGVTYSSVVKRLKKVNPKIKIAKSKYDGYDLLEMNKSMSKCAIARFFKVSEAAIRNRLKKLEENLVSV